jgi:adenylosuccinate lyase
LIKKFGSREPRLSVNLKEELGVKIA